MQQIDKAAKYPAGHGYEARTHGAPSSIVVHSTSNKNKNTSFASEVAYLLDTPLASAHYLIGKDGHIVQFLAPLPWAAWHAGRCQPAYSNEHSIGIELHHSVGDPPYPREQLAALRGLLNKLCSDYSIPLSLIETHGQIAIKGPYQRKTDPADWTHERFIAWRNTLGAVSLPTASYRVKGLPVYERSDKTGPLWGHLNAGERVEVDDISNGHLKDGRGFVDLSGLEETQ